MLPPPPHYQLALIKTMTSCGPVTTLIVATIGFLQNYNVSEDEGSIDVDIQLLSGELGREVEVRVFTVDGSAQGIILNRREFIGVQIFLQPRNRNVVTITTTLEIA